ncbi:bifunctional [glutamate--ammonia ligase]-adenylyl-L-tyrosine phosphorylase/[glutamate--ammonia-ligase] adenylyltransferase [Candidatus Methylomirabilis sp.]|uniref:bifunctional [glutamate--ammonia ligase]-adenylyl-L-tyrosine phosphorylase/[glutamate--ammonia-ligase] adenylyltransferase n=1 Tax=Candidatus Methylomirabilis sp. TaxID=2032687 RepID=UPI002A66B38F|nr:bifunctional [glutamate--ammonia ligase]-adenylyl-L-tyrosine phosphorylase/[glutamate--ammonia-ligase] adenylyltransferase [Candidatus Methylomirabilis sp.]
MKEPFPPGVEALAAAGCRYPEQARQNLQHLAGSSHLTSVQSILPLLLDRLRNLADPDMALNNLERYAEVVIDRGFLFSHLRDSPKSLDLLLTLFGSSQHLSDILIRFPQDFHWLLQPGLLRRTRSKEELVEDLNEFLSRAKSQERAWTALRRFKMREILRIGIQDLLDNLDLTGVTQQLSLMADVVLHRAYEICRAELVRRYGEPRCVGPSGDKVCGFVVIGMGKLGGEELNFSSDIDLLFIYEGEGETAGLTSPSGALIGRVSNHEFFTRLGEGVIKAIGELTSEGRVFRVDMRLRPEGRAGALVYSLRGYELYYESWGQTWERMALIKARPVAGDPALGEAFLKLVEPFAYRRSLDYGAIGEIRAMKDRINAKVGRDQETFRHVKLGYGGIREIEFIVQTFQLLYGASDPWIREPNTLRALQRLADRGHVTVDEHATLAKAYTFLRTVEHRLQILHHLQTHTLPTDHGDLVQLARRLGYSPNRSPDPALALREDYQRHIQAVRQMYDHLLREPPMGEEEIPLHPLADFLDGRADESVVRESLTAAGIVDLDRAVRSLFVLRDGPPFRRNTTGTQRILATLAPTLMEGLTQAPDPDLALLHLERFIEGVGSSAGLYDIFKQAPLALVHLMRLFGASEFLSQILIRHPALLDLLLVPDQPERGRPDRLVEECLDVVADAPPGSPRLDALRRFKQAEELRIGILDLLRKADLDEVSRALTRLSEACVQTAYRLACEELRPQYGLPSSGGFVVLGLGKCGAEEIGYGSDLDLAFAYAQEGATTGGSQGMSHAEYFERLADKICRNLTTITKEGTAYRVDIRLRPGGSAGRVAQSFAAFETHFARTAELWERQAYLRVRPIAGDLNIAEALMASLSERIYRPTSAESLAANITAMRHRMEVELTKEKTGEHHVKLGSGGIVDIEFIIQFLQLAYGSTRSALRVGNTLKALEAARGVGLLADLDVAYLCDSYRFLRTVQNRLRVVADLETSALPKDPNRLDRLARRLEYEAGDGVRPGERLLADYQRHTERVRGIYEATFSRYNRGESGS